MNQVATKVLSTAFVLASLAPSALAQRDRIVWNDGKVSDKVQVLEFTWRQIRFKERGQTEMRSADTVASLRVSKALDAFKRGYGAANDDEAYDNFLREARKRAAKEPFLAQFGYIESARVLLKNGQTSDAFAVLEELVEKLPNTGFFPHLFRHKMDEYLAAGEDKLKDAGTVAGRYAQTALRGGWPDGFAQEAKYYEIMVGSLGGELKGNALSKELQTLLGKTEGAYPSVANRVKVQLAHALRANKQNAAARKAYEEILDENNVSDGTRAQALLGLGHTHLEEGDPTKTEPYRSALLSFLRVYLETVGAPDEAKAEALHFAAFACEKWRGPDSGAMARRLRGHLHHQYSDSRWAKR